MIIFRRLLGFLAPYRRGLAVSWALASLAMVMTVALPALTGRAVEAIRKGASLAGHHEAASLAHERHVLLLLAFTILGVVLARWALTFWRRLIAGRVSLAVEYDLRGLMYRQLQRLELSFFDHQQTGQLMSRATVDLQAVRFFLGYGLVFILQSILTITLAGVVMIAINPRLGLISLIPVPFVVAISYSYGRRARPAIQETQQRIGELTADAEENISGVRVVKAFAREPRQLERFRATVGRVFDQAMLVTRLEAGYNPVIGFLPQLGLAAVLLLDREPQLTEAPGASELPPGSGHVRLSHVSLRYGPPHDELIAEPGAAAPGPGRTVLHDIDLDVPAGRNLALVGPTGSGKTSLVALISRLYDPSSGAVLIDGVDVREASIPSVRGAVAVVSDDPFLFSASVAENIAYARPGAPLHEVEAAARRAQAHEFIARMPHGYDTQIGERGLMLSGGQRQRLAIARALVADPRVLILDDATSSVDASTEQSIKLALAEAMAGRTTFVIAHRLSTIALADEVVVLDHGRIVARGPHEELFETSALYRELASGAELDGTGLEQDEPQDGEVPGESAPRRTVGGRR